MRAARWKDIPLPLASWSGTGGIYAQIAETAYGDLPIAEYLGQRPHQWTLEVVYTGPGALGMLETLQRACSEDEAGWLVLPDGTTVWATASEALQWAIASEHEAKATLTLVEVLGQPKEPEPDVMPQVKAAAKSTLASDAQTLVARLESIRDQVLAAYDYAARVRASIQAITDYIQAAGAVAMTAVASAQQMTANLEMLLTTPSRIATTLTGLWDYLTSWRDCQAILPALVTVADMPSAIPVEYQDTPEAASYQTTGLMLAALMTRTLDVLAQDPPATYDDAVQVLDSLRAAATAVEPVDTAWGQIVSEAYRGLMLHAVDLPRLRAYELPGVYSLLEATWERYGSLDMYAEVLARNPSVLHPGYVRGQIVTVD